MLALKVLTVDTPNLRGSTKSSTNHTVPGNARQDKIDLLSNPYSLHDYSGWLGARLTSVQKAL
jgi:hypothetical protein